MKLEKQGRMTANLEGLFKLLSEKLYSNRDIFVRELIQNGYDAITRRCVLEPNFCGTIDIITDADAQTLTFIDNGIGMSLDDIEKFLSVVGSSGTKSEAQFNENLLTLTVGQFGIGFLSAFAVAKKITVDTLKIGEKQSFLWSSEGSLDYNIYQSNKSGAGTKITIYLADDFGYYINVDKLKKIIINYSNLIPVAISINNSERVNSMYAPWETDGNEQEYEEFITKTFQEFPKVVLPVQIKSRELNVTGVLYIPDRISDIGLSVGKLDIYIRRMLVKENDSLLLPEWASFIRGVLDCQELSPNSARDGFKVDDKVFNKLRNEIEKFIFENLVYIYKRDSELFIEIYVEYCDSLKKVAIKDRGFFEKISDYILFVSNNSGNIYTIPQYINVSPSSSGKTTIYYCTDSVLFAKLDELDSSDKLVLDASSPLDEELLKKYAEHHSGVELQCVNATVAKEVFVELSEAENKVFERLVHDMQRFINRRVYNRIIVEVKHLSNKSIISTLLDANSNEAEDLWRKLQIDPTIMQRSSVIMDEISRAKSKLSKKLVLNSKNHFVEQLARNEYDSQTTLEVIYEGFLYYAFLSVAKAEDDRFTAKSLIDDFLSEIFKLLEIKKSQQLDSTAGDKVAKKTIDRNHVQLFLIFPSKGYTEIEAAVRTVFENPPFFFEVSTSTAYIHKGVFTDNVIEHIKNADAFIAEISMLDENVMMEVGAILISGDSRPLFALRHNDAKPLPADIKSNLYIPYSSNGKTAVSIANDIKHSIFRDGIIVYDDINQLLLKRKKRFLSHTLLDTVRARLSQEDIEKILKKYKYVEDVLADETGFTSLIGDEGISNLVLSDLRKYTQ